MAALTKDQRYENHRTHVPHTAADCPQRETLPDHPKGCGICGKGAYVCRVCGATEKATGDAPCTSAHRPMLAVPEMAAHARLGPSDGERWWNCPGSIRESAGKERSTSIYAKTGTAAHAVAEACLVAGGWPAALVGSTVEGVEINRDTAESVRTYVAAVRERADELGVPISVEGKADLRWIDPDLFGTYDARLLQPFGECEVWDYKNGSKVVEASALQLKLYALDALRFDPETVRTVVAQPNAQHEDGPIRSHVYTAAELRAWIPEVAAHAAATRDPNAPLAAGAWCHYCPAAATCPKLQERSLAVAQADFGVVPPKPTGLTPGQVAQVLTHAALVEAWIEAVVSHARNLAQRGVAIPGYKVVAGRLGNRQWSDELRAAEAIKARGVDPYETTVISPAEAEKKVGKKTFAAALAALTSRSAGKPALVPESDKRPAISCGPEADFDAVPSAD